MQFKDIPGQTATKEFLQSLFTKERLPHALLFIGREGSGKLPLALALANLAQCSRPVDGDSCGECPACRKTHKYIHPDIFFTFPTIARDEKGTPSSAMAPEWRRVLQEKMYFNLNGWRKFIDEEKKQLNIPLVSIREVIKFCSMKAYEGSRKIVLIWHAELMEKEGNRLLKLIEEPPPDTVFLLITDHPEQLLPTIVSRCQIIQVPPFREEDIRWFAQHKLQLDSAALTAQIAISNGNLTAFLETFEEGNDILNKALVEWLRIAYKGKAIPVLEWADDFSKYNKDDQKHFFKFGLGFFEQLFLSFHLDKDQLRVDQNNFETIQKMKSILDIHKTIAIIELLNDNIQYIERNAAQKLNMINSSLTLHKIMVAKANEKG